MLINSSGVNINVYVKGNLNSDTNILVLLHGFTGSSLDWTELIENLSPEFFTIAVDLIGHGKSDSPDDISLYTADAISKQILDVINHFTDRKVCLLGYSMGGRAALTFSVKYPEKVKALILESTSPGIKDEVERTQRVESDNNLAQFILTNPIEYFVDKWMNLEIFGTQKKLPAHKLNEIRERKLLNNKTGLANSLKGFGTGVMPHVYEQLKDIIVPTLLITGELDKKFTEINFEMAKILSNAVHSIVSGVGHNVHLEGTESYISIINKSPITF
ncbi:MAG: 2-succinyl-6-hydroxy-2,4-cyclohexadiene-1-carboxylate synthase [Ignavibacteriales bacterium]|nr:MAG: 2-succinyl-6-hydroxy-2,4-cyclohexadiene-1-carboxylate synthase [Ignavibacteriales bacterium]